MVGQQWPVLIKNVKKLKLKKLVLSSKESNLKQAIQATCGNTSREGLKKVTEQEITKKLTKIQFVTLKEIIENIF